MTEQPNRIYFLDNLRGFVIVLVVVLHISMIYMQNPVPWFPVVDPQRSLLFTYVAALLDIPIMMMLFFIAAYFVLPSLFKRDQKTFLRDKFIRIGIPWIAGVLFVAPATGYLAYRSRGIPMGLLKFWATDFWSVRYNQLIYWFLGVLLLFFVLVSFVDRLSGGWRSLPRQISKPSWKMPVTFWTITTLALFLLSELGVTDEWYTRWYLLVFQPWRVPLYVGYFILGIMAYQNGWFTAGGYKPRLVPWSVLWILSSVLYVCSRAGGNRLKFVKIIHIFDQSPVILNAENALFYSTVCLCSLMVGAAFFQRYFNGAGRFQKRLADCSYGIYFIHPLILYPLAYIFVDISLPLYVKASAVFCLTLFSAWVVSALVLRKVPVLNRIL